MSTRRARASSGKGSYLENLNEAKTHNTELNVFAAFEPKIPEAYRDSEFLFLANIDPVLQRRVREAMPDVKLVAGDTMNYWIKDHRPALLEVLKGLDILLINDTETKMLAGNNNLVQAARAVLALGPKTLVVKHGEYGATSCSTQQLRPEGHRAQRSAFRAPALPLEEVVDPTGAGDSFAGGFFGYLASQPRGRTHSGRLPARHVLRQRDGLVRRASASAPSGCSSSRARRSTTASACSAS